MAKNNNNYRTVGASTLDERYEATKDGHGAWSLTMPLERKRDSCAAVAELAVLVKPQSTNMDERGGMAWSTSLSSVIIVKGILKSRQSNMAVRKATSISQITSW